MRSSKIFSLALVGLFLSFFSQCRAASSDPVAPAGKPAASLTASPTSSTNAISRHASNGGNTIASSKHSSFGKKLFGVISGIAVGTPVCMVRKPMDEDKYAVADLTGNSTKGRAVLPTAVIWAPFSVVQGVLEAPFFAFNNSIVNYDKPFSKEQFSLVNKASSVKTEEQLPEPAPHDVR
jgi:hypothetical protein